MSGPVRLQLSRRKGFNLQALSRETNGLPAVNVARPSQWGNNFPITPERSADLAKELFHHDVEKFMCFHPQKYEQWIKPLRGKNLACWCSTEPGTHCHADVLLCLANDTETQP